MSEKPTASFCARREAPACVFCVPLFLKPDRSRCPFGATAIPTSETHYCSTHCVTAAAP